MLEDLLPAAINQAGEKAKQLHMEMMQSLTAGFDIPGLSDAISQMTSGASKP
jgi:DNA-binding protein YbaB